MVQNKAEMVTNKTKGDRPSLLGIIYNPSEQFEKIRKRPTFWLPLLLITLLFVIGTYLSLAQLNYTELLGDTIPADQMEAVMQVSKIIGAISSLFVPFIVVLIGAAIYLIVAKIAKSDVTYKQLLSMQLFIMFISALGTIFNGLYTLVTNKGTEAMFTNVAGLIGSNNAVLGSIEIFTIWGVVLTAIGLQRVATLSKSMSWTIAIVFYCIRLGFVYVSSVFSQLLGGL